MLISLSEAELSTYTKCKLQKTTTRPEKMMLVNILILS